MLRGFLHPTLRVEIRDAPPISPDGRPSSLPMKYTSPARPRAMAGHPPKTDAGTQCHVPGHHHPPDPFRRAPMIAMIAPSPGNQNVDVEQVMHQGKSDNISFTASVASGATPGIGAKIIAPVNSQRTRCGRTADFSIPVAR